ncbi:MAG TPA: DUF4350 domain-containing protein [Actinomycetota bacterium]|nr:DUF4350 domain-containing protein [Actinomycetota bacterium]
MRRFLPWVVLVLGVLLVAVVGGRRAEEGTPLDPDSPAPLGTKAIVEVLRELGARVTVSGDLPDTGAATALLLSDDLNLQRREGLLAWVRRGGTLVVADPSSGVTAAKPVGTTRVGLLDAQLQRRCDVAALRDADRVSAPGGLVFEVPQGGGVRGCFPRGGGAWLLVQPLGAGNVVRLGGASAVVNQELGEADNAVLLTSLLAPSADSAVWVLRPPLPGGGSASLGDLVGPRVRLALWQLVVAFVVLALWRSRRLGRPVVEPQPVQLPGSELVVAVGNLLQRAKGRGQAAGLLSDDLLRSLAERLGLPPSTPADQVADAAAQRTGIRRERVLRALAPQPPRDEAELVALSQAIDAVRREVTSVSEEPAEHAAEPSPATGSGRARAGR